jgi:2,3-bisphosphoglycerate-independent phosphoglycerate mutase
VRDGWGYSEKIRGNAVLLANTPNNDFYLENYPWTLLKCTGYAVGLPEGTQGGSEPGHLTMGAGRVVWQPLEEINRSIRNGSFYEKQPFLDAVNHCKEHGSKLHLGGLLSDQGIHGTTSHLHALLEFCVRVGFSDVFIHCFLDGRDVPKYSSKFFLNQTLEKIYQLGVGKIASLVGRYYAMDRDKNWLRTKAAYDLLTKGYGVLEEDPVSAVYRAYKRDDVSDYYVKPIIIVEENRQPVSVIEDNDAFIFWNFRSDRARQMTYALTQDHFREFKREKIPQIFFVCMSVYDQTLDLPVAFPQKFVKNNLGKVLSDAGLRQLRIAETEKYAHVTFFFNSQVEDPNDREDRILVPSHKVASYEEKPEMSATEITERLITEIRKCSYDFILVNYANGDLVGHSANLEAGIMASEVVDECVGRVVTAGLNQDYCILLTGDHGNVETMFYPDETPNPSHGMNPVPFFLLSKDNELKSITLRKDAGLSSVAPSVLWLMDLNKPSEMTSDNIFD